MKKLSTNFVGQTAKSDIARLGNAETMNMFVENCKDDYATNTILRSMPGYNAIYTNIVNGYPRGVFKTSTNDIFHAHGNTLYCNGTAVKTISNSSKQCSFVEVGGLEKRLLVCDGSAVYAVKLNTGIQGLSFKDIELPDNPRYGTSSSVLNQKIVPKRIVNFHDFIMVLAEDTDRIYYSCQYPWEYDYEGKYDDYEQAIYNYDENDIFMLHWSSRTYSEFNSDNYIGSKSITAIAEATLEDNDVFKTTESGTYTYNDASINANKRDLIKYQNGSFVKVDYETTEIYPMGAWITCDYNNDITSDIAVCNGKLYATAMNSTQCFSYAGGDCVYGSPFSNTNENSDIGSYSDCTGTIASNLVRYGSNGVYIGNTKISNDYVDRMLGTDVKLYSYKWYSHELAILKGDSISLAYDISSQSWITLTSNSNGTNIPIKYDFYGNYAQTGNALCELTESIWTEHDGNIVPRKRKGKIISLELGQEFQLDGLRFILNNGQCNGEATLTVTSNLSETDLRYVNLGEQGDYSNVVEFYDFGVAREFEVELSTSTASKFAILGLEFDYKGASY